MPPESKQNGDERLEGETVPIADEQRDFYDELFRRHGDDPRALSHRDRPTQQERFYRMSRLFGRERGPFTIHEVGCGLGHFGEFLAERFPEVAYSGSEVNPEFVEACRRRFPQGSFFLRDVSKQLPEDRYDFVTLSGVFNIPLSASRDAWRDFIHGMLESMYRMANNGIAVDFLSGYCDADRMNPDLHYQAEKEILDFAAAKLSRHFELDGSGPLYEYTLRVYRPRYVRTFYGEPEFSRYFGSDD
jgi:SAM-dependent methyltransferase